MEPYSNSRLDKAGRFCAKYTFILGSMILLLFCLTGISELRVIGLIYFVGAVLINLFLMFVLFIYLLIYPKDYLDILKTAAIILFNLPVAIFYLWLTEELQQKVFQISTTI